MKNYSFSDEIKRATSEKRLVELQLDKWQMRVGYIIGFDSEYLMYAAVSPKVSLEEIAVIHLSSVTMIRLSGLYLDKFTKKVTSDNLFLAAKKTVLAVQKPTFDGFISAFAGKNILVEIDYGDEDKFACKIVAHDETSVMIDEYYSEQAECYSRTIIRKDRINRVAINLDWLIIIDEFLKESKN